MELGVGYLSIVADTRQMPGQLQRALDGGQARADKAGQSMGSKIAGGLGKTLKVGVVSAGAAAAGVLATSITKGLGRLNAIEQAQAKLSGLGHSTQSVGKIMDNAMASVKGTAYGLGDAAGIAAGAVAAGVKPGKDLERTLKLVGDAAAIAGTDLGSMGAIFNKVAASNKIQGDVIAQLNDAGIPIIQLLGQELGKTAEETVKLASEGKINFTAFQNAMEKGLGGAALKTGNTTKGALDNMNAALGRFGATLAGPLFRQAPAGLTGLTKAIDELDTRAKPVMARFEADLTGKYIPALKGFGQTGFEAFQKIRSSDLVQVSVARLGGVLEDLVDTARDAAPAIGSIITSLSKVSGAVGISTWQLFLGSLEAATAILGATLVPLLNTTASLLDNNTGAVAALALGFTAFKTIPALAGRITGALAPIGAAAKKAATEVKSVATASGAVSQVAGYGSVQMGRFGSAIAEVGKKQPFVAKLQQSFLDGAASADRFGRTLGTVRATSTGLKTALGGAVTALGGPVGIGLIATAAAMSGISSVNSKIAASADELASSNKRAAETQKGLLDELVRTKGVVDEGVYGKVKEQVDDLFSYLDNQAGKSAGWWDKTFAGLDDIVHFRSEWEKLDKLADEQDKWDWATQVKDSLDLAGVSAEQFSRAISGSKTAAERMIHTLQGPGGEETEASKAFRSLRDQFLNAQYTASKMTPGMSELSDAVGVLADKASSASERSGALRKALEALGIIEPDATQAMADYGESVAKIASGAGSAIDGTNGLGNALLDANGKLDVFNNAGARELHSKLGELSGDFLNAATASGNAAAEYDKATPALEKLAEASGLSIGKIRELAASYGMVPDKVQTLVDVQGKDEALQALTAFTLKASEVEGDGPITIGMTVADEGAREAFRQLGLEVKVLDETTGAVTITAKNEAALLGVQAVVASLANLDKGVATPKINANTTAFRLEDQSVRDKLSELDRTGVAPEISALIDKFMQGREVTMAELSKIDLSTAEPDVLLLIEQALAQAKVVNDAIDQAARRREAHVDVVTRYFEVEGAARAAMTPEQVRDNNATADYSRGGSRGRASGGRLPTTGPGTDRTDGFLAVTSAGMPIARVDAGEWVINSANSEKYNRELAMINAGTFPKLPGFANGGVVGNDALHALVDGRTGGASRPLTGAPYVWGGVNWGDCSGAMSAIARFAVGLAPFAARFATGNMREALRAMGFLLGRGGPGDLRFGWYNGGPYGGHTAGTLPDGTNVEMGGAYGGGMVGGSTGSNSPEFTDHAYLPIRPGFDWSDPGGYPSGGRGRVTKSGSRKRPEWTDKQQLDLENAEIEVRKAEEARTKVEEELAKGKKTQTDLDSANKKVELAQQKVVDLQQKKDDVANWVEDGPAPQAPALSRMFTDAEIERLDAQLAVQSANDRRNEVYDNPDSSDLDLAKADAELYKAEKALLELGSQKPGDGPKSWSELAGNAAKAAVSGFLSDALGVFGIPDELPPMVRAWQMFEKAQAEQNPYLLEPSADERAAGAQVGPIDPGMAPLSAILGDSPVLYDAQRGIAQWGDQIADGLNQIGGPASDAAVALRAELEKFRGAGRYWNGGTVEGPPGVDKVPAWLTAKEIVLNTAAAAAGDNAAIAAAMNAGTKFLLGGQSQQGTRQGPGGTNSGESWRPGVQITNQITVSNEQSQIRKLRESNERLLMQYGGAK